MIPAEMATENPTTSDTLPPYSTRENSSRPISSVPNQCLALAGSKTGPVNVWW